MSRVRQPVSDEYNWQDVKQRILSLPLFAGTDPEALEEHREQYIRAVSGLIFAGVTEYSEPAFIFLLACARGDDITELHHEAEHILMRPGIYTYQFSLLPGSGVGYEQLGILASAADAVATDFVAQASSKTLFGDGSEACVQEALFSFVARHREAAAAYDRQADAYMEKIRMTVNNAASCLCLAEKHNEAGDGVIAVIFKNGTYVTVSDEEQEAGQTLEEYAGIRLKDSVMDGPYEYIECGVEAENGEPLMCVVQSSELGCMSGVFNYYYESEDWSHIDRGIALGLRRRDIEECEIVAVIRE